MTGYTIVKIFAIRTKNKLVLHIFMHCRAIGKITNQSIYMRTSFIFPYGTMIEWVTIFKFKKESLYSFNCDFKHTSLLYIQLIFFSFYRNCSTYSMLQNPSCWYLLSKHPKEVWLHQCFPTNLLSKFCELSHVRILDNSF